MKIVKPCSVFDLPFDLIKKIGLQISTIQKEALVIFGMETESQQLEQYVTCRFGGASSIPVEFDTTTTVYWECGKRNTCNFEGIICGFVRYKGLIITPLEVRMMQLLSSELTNEQISEILQMGASTFDFKKQQLYEKLAVSSKQSVARIALELKIIESWTNRKTLKELMTS